MVLCVYVDDNRLKYAFMAALRADFSVNPGATAEDNFLGFQHIRFPDGSLHIYAGGLIDKLAVMLEDPGLSTTKCVETPMEPEGPRQLQADPSGDNLPLPAGEVTWVRSALGLPGFIIGHARPDGYVVFVFLAQVIAHWPNYALFKATARLARYLVSTRELKLTYRKVSGYPRMFSDAGENAMGYVFGYEGSGLIDWVAGRNRAADSSGADELLAATRAGKAVLSWRTFSRELQIPLGGLTELLIDSTSAL